MRSASETARGREPLSARAKVSAALNVALALLAIGSWLTMFLRAGDNGRLASANWESLKYFTILSNLLMAAAGLLWAALLLGRRTSHRALVLKFAGTVSVSLTFLTVMLFLGPMFGYPPMFAGVSLHLHLTVPVVAALDFVFLCREGELRPKDALWGALPMALYGVWYVGNNLINGVGVWPATNDFYGFFTWGKGVAGVIAVVMVIGTWGLAHLLRFLRGKFMAK